MVKTLPDLIAAKMRNLVFFHSGEGEKKDNLYILNGIEKNGDYSCVTGLYSNGQTYLIGSENLQDRLATRQERIFFYKELCRHKKNKRSVSQ